MIVGHQTQSLTKIGFELQKLFYTERERTHTVPTAGSRRKRCTYKNTPQKDWTDCLQSAPVGLFHLLCLLTKRLVVLRPDRCGFFSFLFSLSYDWKGLEWKWENGYFSPGVFWAAEKWVETLSLVSLLFASSSILDFFFSLCFWAVSLVKRWGKGERGIIAIILLSM